MRMWLAILVLGLLAACQRPNSLAGDAVLQDLVEDFGAGYGETRAAAQRVGVDYRQAVAGALGRDRRALHRLFWLTVHADLDAAASVGHADALGTILRQLGDMDFGRALAGEPAEIQAAVREYLLYDLGEEDPDSPDALEDAHSLYPHTFPPPREVPSPSATLKI